ncbi:MAG: hypothetical protein ACEY3M_15880 [Wolbachia sp.]
MLAGSGGTANESRYDVGLLSFQSGIQPLLCSHLVKIKSSGSK